MNREQIIGVVAGVGPFAGIDLLNKIAQETQADRDQEHLTVVSVSQPSAISDRTVYLLKDIGENPGHAIAANLRSLRQMGATVAGIPCNTAHAPLIFDLILKEKPADLKVLHMIDETAGHLRRHHSGLKRVGVLSTTGTRDIRIYPTRLEAAGFTVVLPDDDVQENEVQSAIYDLEYGIKAKGVAALEARQKLLFAIKHLQLKGAQAVILGCTEVPLVIHERQIDQTTIVDPTRLLARALIREINPDHLRPHYFIREQEQEDFR